MAEVSVLWAKRLFLFRLSSAITAERKKMNNSYYGGCDPPIPWIGGKTVLIPIIRKVMPEYPKKYVEVFGGGGAVTFSGRIAPVQIYNDFNQHLVNFMRILKTRSNELIDRLLGVYDSSGHLCEEFKRRFFFNSRDLFMITMRTFYHTDNFEQLYDRLCKLLNGADTLDEKLHAYFLAEKIMEDYRNFNDDPALWDAVFFFILMKCSYSATGTSWAIKPVNYNSIVRLLNDAAIMLQGVIIENKDCIELIVFHDGKGVFFYCDPPYYEAEDLYSGVPLFGDSKHIELHDTLLNCEGKVLLSYNECDFIDSLYSEDKWYKMRISRPHNMVLHNGGGQMYNEFLIANYDIFEPYSFGAQTTFFEEFKPYTEGERIIL